MGRRKAQTALADTVLLDELWTRRSSFTANGRMIDRGTELSITGQPGARYVFHEHVATDEGHEWITVFGGRSKEGQWRSFDPSRIKTVHRVEKRRPTSSPASSAPAPSSVRTRRTSSPKGR